MPIILKTDINGNVLWEKRIRRMIDFYYNYTYLIDSYVTNDGGLIVTGATNSQDECLGDNCLDAFVMKLNACGEKDWCKIYSVPMDVEEGVSVLQLPNNNYLVQVNYFGYDDANKRIWLFCLDPNGETIWQKVYCQEPTNFYGESGWNTYLVNDDKILITGDCWVSDPLVPQNWYIVPLFIKTNANGELIYSKEWTTDPNHFSGDISRSCEDYKGNYWTATKAYIADTLPFNCGPGALVHTHKDGNAIKYLTYTQNLVPNEGAGRVTTVVELDTNLLLVTNGWGNYVPFNTVYHVNTYLSDTNGVILAEKELLLNESGITKSIVTSDHKVLMTAGHYFPQTKWDMYLYKLLPNLDYDTLDTRLLTYDSLCPHAIVSDTIPLDCDIMVGIDEAFSNPARSSLQAYPNPSSGVVTLVLPECYLSQSSMGTLSVQTANYVWPNGKQLELTNLQGNTLKAMPWPDGQNAQTINLAGLAPGTYIARITNQDRALCQCTVMVVK